MNCKDIEKLIQDAVAGEITSVDREILEQHIADCAKCSSEYNSLMQTIKMASSRIPPDPTPQDWQRMRCGIRQATQPVRREPYFWRRRLAPALALVVVLIGIALFVVHDHPVQNHSVNSNGDLANERSLIKEQLIYEFNLEDLYAYDQEESDLDNQLEDLEWIL